MKKYFFIIVFVFASALFSYAQKRISGFVYEDQFRTPLANVAIFTTSGNKSFSDSTGFFLIPVSGKKDSLYFTYKNRNTKIFSIDTIKNPDNFEITIHLNVLAKKKLPPGHLPDVTVYSNNYRLDSLQNRRDYADIFNFRKPNIGDIASVPKIGNIPIPLGVYFDVNAIAQSFQFRKNKRKEIYRDFAIWLEQEKYIDYRFNKRLVQDITKLSEKNLNEFLKLYRPEFEILVMMNDTELGSYTKKCLQNYSSKNTPQYFKEKLKKGIFLEENKK